jgi:S1-C subfamily serine protease
MAQQKMDPDDDHCNEPLTSVFKRVSPSVVFITAVSINPYRPNDRVEHAVGSGFLIDSSGLILTNSHLVFWQPVDRRRWTTGRRYRLR